jgi:hypothetical protein
MKELIKEFLVTVAITIGFTISVIISLRFNFRFISGFICCPTLLLYYAVYMMGNDLYKTYKDERDRTRRDEQWRKEQLIREVIES